MIPAGKAGPQGLPSRPESSLLIQSAGTGVPLRAGAFVSLRVLADLGGGDYRVLAGGQELRARAGEALVVGSLLRAKVEEAPRGAAREGSPAFLLRILPTPAEKQAGILATLGLPADAAGRAALAASLAEGLKPEAPRLARLRRAALTGGEGEEGERAAIAARLEAKGFEASAEAVEALVDLARGGAGRGGRGGDGERGPGDSPAGGQSPEIGRATEVGLFAEGEELVAALAGLFRELFGRADPRSGLLGLYNHARAGDGELLVPFQIELGEIAFKGSFRLHLARIPGGPLGLEGRFRAYRVDSDDGTGASWGFSLETAGRGRSMLRLSAPDPSSLGDLEGLRSALLASGCELRLGAGDEDGPAEVDVNA
jgi:hypothetical protein